MDERCEWNPKFGGPSSDPIAWGDCENQATVCLGRTTSWHLCDSCAALPEFKRFKVRVALRISVSASREQTK